jgi:hypothetical protein
MNKMMKAAPPVLNGQSTIVVAFLTHRPPTSIPRPVQFRIDAEVVAELTAEQRAHSLRLNWMRRMGLDENEIMEAIEHDPPHSIEEELIQIRALDKLAQITPSNEAWQKVAVEY